MVSFAGYPLGGYAAFLLTGRVDSPGPALAGGLLTGVVLGAIQVWAHGAGAAAPAGVDPRHRGRADGRRGRRCCAGRLPDRPRFAGRPGCCDEARWSVSPRRSSLVPRLGALAFVWPLFLSGTFAIGWAVTTSAGIDVDQQFTIFGSSGALVATLLTAVLPLVLNSRHTTEERAS